MDVHVRDLRYFVAVAEERSFTRAAARLFISQPALSKQVRHLELQLRAVLIIRGVNESTLTAAGVALLPHAREQVRQWEIAQRDVAAAAATDSAVLTVGFPTAPSRGLLAAATARFVERNPGWRLQPRQIPWNDSTAGLADASSDIAILWLPLADPAPYRWRELLSEARHVALPRGHPLSGSGAVSFEALRDEHFLALPQSAGSLRSFWLAVEERGGDEPAIGGTVSTAEETFEAVANGLGVALLSAGNAQIYRHSDVVTLPVEGLSPTRLAVVWRRDDDRPITASLVEACVEAARDRASADGFDVHGAPSSLPPDDRDVRSFSDASVSRESGVVRIGVSGHAEPLQSRLLQALAHGTAVVPIATIPSDSSASRISAVLRGDLDAAFARVGRSPSDELDHVLLASHPLVLAIPSSHRLADVADAISISELDRETVSFYPREQNPWWYDEIVHALRLHGAEPRMREDGMWVYDVLSEVAAGRAVALVSAPIAHRARLENVVYRRLVPTVLMSHHALIASAGTTHTGVRKLVELARQSAPSSVEPPHRQR